MPDNLLTGPGFLIGFFLGVLVGWVTLWSFLNPQVGRIVARIFAVLALGIGVCWIVIPIADLLHGETNPQYESFFGQGGFGSGLGWGGGAFAAGVTALVFSFLRREGTSATSKREDKPSAGEEG
jgi:hypothetical protein